MILEKQIQLGMQAAAVWSNKLLAEVPEMPGEFSDDLESKFHMMAKIIEADTHTEQLFLSAIY